METQSPEISQLQEARSEIHLTSEGVSRLFNKCTSNIDNGGRKYHRDILNEVVFNNSEINDKENIVLIEKFADQLRSSFFKKDIGCEWHEAGQDKFYKNWAESIEDVKKLLALTSVIGLGRFTTTGNEYPMKYVVDKERYQLVKSKK